MTLGAIVGAIADLQQIDTDAASVSASLYQTSVFAPKQADMGSIFNLDADIKTGELLLRGFFKGYLGSGDHVYLGLDRYIWGRLLALPADQAIVASERVNSYLSFLSDCSQDEAASQQIEQLICSVSLSIMSSGYYAFLYAACSPVAQPNQYYTKSGKPGNLRIAIKFNPAEDAFRFYYENHLQNQYMVSDLTWKKLFGSISEQAYEQLGMGNLIPNAMLHSKV